MKHSAIIAIVTLVLILLGVNWSIANKENQLKTGRVIYLELKPIDPRSLVQGDYMSLRFKIGDQIMQTLRDAQVQPEKQKPNQWWAISGDGYVVVKLDNKGVASYQRIDKGTKPLAGNELKIRYRVRNGTIKLATNAFFFQEGTAQQYEKARYGQFRVAKDGELLLSALYDSKLKRLGGQTP